MELKHQGTRDLQYPNTRAPGVYGIQTPEYQGSMYQTPKHPRAPGGLWHSNTRAPGGLQHSNTRVLGGLRHPYTRASESTALKQTLGHQGVYSTYMPGHLVMAAQQDPLPQLSFIRARRNVVGIMSASALISNPLSIKSPNINPFLSLRQHLQMGGSSILPAVKCFYFLKLFQWHSNTRA